MRLKSTLFAAVLTASLVAPAFANEETVTTPLPQFTAADTQMLFEQDAMPMQLAALSPLEMKETEGAWVNFTFVGAAAGPGFYAWHHQSNSSNMPRGAVFPVGTGAPTGGADGGRIAGNIAWRANFVATNFGFSKFYNSRGGK